MTNLEKYTKVFTETFEVNAEQAKTMSYRSSEQWDSVGHMDLVSALEAAFGIMMDSDDVFDLTSFEKGKEILKKYDIVIA